MSWFVKNNNKYLLVMADFNCTRTDTEADTEADKQVDSLKARFSFHWEVHQNILGLPNPPPPSKSFAAIVTV